MADDIAALIGHLGLDQPDLVGFSLGGGVALQLAAKHPDLIGRLVLTSVYIRSDALDPAIAAQQSQVNGAAADFMVGTPPYELYQRVAPRPEDSPVSWTSWAAGWRTRSTTPRRSAASGCRR